MGKGQSSLTSLDGTRWANCVQFPMTFKIWVTGGNTFNIHINHTLHVPLMPFLWCAGTRATRARMNVCKHSYKFLYIGFLWLNWLEKSRCVCKHICSFYQQAHMWSLSQAREGPHTNTLYLHPTSHRQTEIIQSLPTSIRSGPVDASCPTQFRWTSTNCISIRQNASSSQS